LTGAIYTQCKFLGHPRSIQIAFPGTKLHPKPEICKADPKDYNPTEDERSEYCIGTDFKKCARYEAAIQMNKGKSTKKDNIEVI
jgi:hypothetical protein